MWSDACLTSPAVQRAFDNFWANKPCADGIGEQDLFAAEWRKVAERYRNEPAVLYRVLFHYFERFLTEYEGRFEKKHGYFRPIIKEVVERYLDCGNPRSGFARVRCPDCRAEYLLTCSCKTRGFCPS